MTDADEARREGEKAGANRYLRDIVAAKVEHLSGRSTDQVEVLMQHVDPGSFTDEVGDVDVAKIEAFAAGVRGAAAPAHVVDPVAEALGRVSKREQTRDRLTGKGQADD
ncbi:hypothetical protein [Herbiconiux sp. VKM Ac-2851]|uniref:hypothetical protein n=1 Tax=Herbiconiux sp. VKM Ac-2851 TaxID=2739025 RepID=UPI0015638F87|nr:hypothetical protein [Herbiconiux sp. VKM Ac-2851]NQX35473.1 hypothetical protein [Herbiconiux sp. VKM Ac-2851]